MDVRLEVNDDLANLSNKLKRMRREVPQRGEEWANDAARYHYRRAYETLSEQGRPGGTPPPLSPMTLKIYSVDGPPDGSGIRNHMRLAHHREPNTYVATFGILNGEPTQIAYIQNDGATYTVTQAMRNALAAKYGIYLSPNTTTIRVPGRHFWDISASETREYARRSLRDFFHFL